MRERVPSSEPGSARRCSTRRFITHGRRRGYTLFELMLVLSILLVLAGLAWPRVGGMYERHRLVKAAEDVRLHLTGCRLRALEKGVIYQFRYLPGGQTYDVQPLVSNPSASSDTATVLSGTLPDMMTFQSATSVTYSASVSDIDNSSSRTAQTSPTTSSSPGTAGQTSTDATVAILFLPDGTADEASLYVVDDKGRRVLLSIRGLTSAVTLRYEGKEGRQ